MAHQNMVGVDISASTLSVAIYQGSSMETSNNPDGFETLLRWLTTHQIHPASSIICMEATGVYGEALCYYLHHAGFSLAVEPPQQVAQAFAHQLRKNDRRDAEKIAEYAHRFHDRLHLWKAPEEIVEYITVLLSTREQLVKQLTAQQNALKAIERKHYRNQVAETAYASLMQHFKEQIKRIDQTMKDLIKRHPGMHHTMTLLMSIPGVGWVFSSYLLVHTQGFTKTLNPKQLAAYVGICPYERQSGSSLNRKPRSAGFGHSAFRKLLYLASMSVRQHRKAFTLYFERKVAQGKSKRLVLNNIANKLIKIIAAVLRTQKPFIENYISIRTHA
ncbi:IS110 family transposase [bacterium]|nr:IS110 family transposase [bacterium]